MDTRQQQELLKRYLKGTATPEEREWVERWYTAFDELEVTFPTYRLTSQQGEQMHSVIMQRIRKGRVIQLWRRVASVAAVIAMILGGVWQVYTSYKEKPSEGIYNYITSKKGQQLKVVLPDSTLLWLNEQSSIKYVRNEYGVQAREVWLEQGEAFFEVKPNEQAPFLVYTGPVKTKVLGTAFNINKSAKHQDVQVSVAHGKVQVSGEDLALGILTKGDQLTYELSTGTYSLRKISPAYAAAWQLGVVDLQNASFAEVSHVFYSIYNKRLTAGNEQIEGNTYTLTLNRNQPEEEALEIITAVHQLNHRIENEEIVVH